MNAYGPCDLADSCDGQHADCPERFSPRGTACGPPVAGPCDAPDTCTGSSADCPASLLVDVECRPSAGPCDIPEVCLGTSPLCPYDNVVSAGVICRVSPVGACDGVAVTCP